ncbi:yrdC domain-containing protein, mitochondrial-like [Anneissia japonica]|uniref:yrdC domain-containing protein, mitochondrial-like n=1 Tax=Anneissia japonica TaxID=1529436 RepID=UPI001425750D|nr:yrdC domain-containing protein, mitochondrial-like [Anneissia japonica]
MISVFGKKMSKIVNIKTDPIAAVALAAKRLTEGKVIAVPTDTIYGIAALAQSLEAVQQLYTIKGRNSQKPIAVCVSQIEDIPKWANVTVPNTLLDEILPGPVTLVFERSAALNPEFNPTTSLIGLRIPDHQFVCQVADQVGTPLALTSANISSVQSSLSIQEFQELWPKLDIVFDGGVIGETAESRLGSTVVNLADQGYYKIIRNGSAYEHTVNILQKHGLKEAR